MPKKRAAAPSSKPSRSKRERRSSRVDDSTTAVNESQDSAYVPEDGEVAAKLDLKSLLTVNENDVALIIGNGINRYGEDEASSATNSWDALLAKLAEDYLPPELRKVPKTVTPTEFYDILELKSYRPRQTSRVSLQAKFCELMGTWVPFDHHKRVVEWAKSKSVPILTTNFEETLSKSVDGCTLRHLRDGPGFTRYYPWETYFSTSHLSDPCGGFGIWHVNGMQHYPDSVRLGLSHYMGSVGRAKDFFQKGKKDGKNDNRPLYASNSADDAWAGANTWLHIVFKKPLIIFGLGLGSDEVFLRWLLIQRAKYFKKFPRRRKKAWYVNTGVMEDKGKKFFLEGVDVTIISVDTHEDLYGEEVWS